MALRLNIIILIFLVACSLVLGQDTATIDLEDEYAPQAILSPSLDTLIIGNIYPGESRTFFLDLANLGDGMIELGQTDITGQHLEVALRASTIAPGQFVRFPVTYTQVGMEDGELLIGIPWQSPRFKSDHYLTIVVQPRPDLPLEVVPDSLHWLEAFTGQQVSTSLTLTNRAPSPLYFSGLGQVPENVRLTALPPVLAGGKSARVNIDWTPSQPAVIAGQLELNFVVDGDNQIFYLDYLGEVRAPLEISPTTLELGTVYAGSHYLRTFDLVNNTPMLMDLIARETDVTVTMLSDSAARQENPAHIIDYPRKLAIRPRATVRIGISLTPESEGECAAGVPYGSLDLAGIAARPEITAQIHGRMILPLVVDSGLMDFGPRPVLESYQRAILLSNIGNTNLALRLNVIGGSNQYFVPPLLFNVNAHDSLEVPIYFRPLGMEDYADTIVVEYKTFSRQHKIAIPITGQGIDQPLIRTAKIHDLTLNEDFVGWQPVADLGAVFTDKNHKLNYRIVHPFGEEVNFQVMPNDQLMVSANENYHGAGEVKVYALNTLEQVEVDTFLFSIRSVNDLPYLAMPLSDIVLREDQEPVFIGNFSEIFIDPDRALDTVRTKYTIYGNDDDGPSLTRSRDDLFLTLPENWSGNKQFILAAMDHADTNVVAFDDFRVSVLAVNDAPVMKSINSQVLIEDDTVHIDWAPLVSDVDNQETDLEFHFNETGGGYLPLSFEPAGTLKSVLRPDMDWHGSVNVRLTVIDPDGAAASKIFQVRVKPDNDPPGAFHALGPYSYDWEDRLIVSSTDTLLLFTWDVSPDDDENLRYNWILLDASRDKVLQELPAGSATGITATIDSAGIYYWTVIAIDSENQISSSDTLALMLETLNKTVMGTAHELSLGIGPNYPNPFGEATRIEFTIPRFSHVQVSVYDAMGRMVRNLLSEDKYGGQYVVIWDGRDGKGQPVPSGPYVAELRSGSLMAHLKLVVVR
jgi:hypothetical protein